MRDTVFEIGDNVVIKGRENEGIWTIDSETKDREGNTMFDLITETPYGANIEEDVYPESLTSEADYLKYLHNIANPSIEFPLFKSYGLTKEQVLEVVMNFIGNQIELHKSLAEEAMNDNNYEFAADYFKEVNILLQIKMMEDKFYHRFVQG